MIEITVSVIGLVALIVLYFEAVGRKPQNTGKFFQNKGKTK